MMQYQVVGGHDRSWYYSVHGDPVSLASHNESLCRSVEVRLTPDGIRYYVGPSVYKWVDADPLVEAMLFAEKGGAT